MPDHGEQQIVDALVTLATGLTTTGARVYDHRVYTYDTVPCWSIFGLDETILTDGQTLGGKLYRQLTVTFEGRSKPEVSDGVSPDQQLRIMRAELEVALAANPTLSGKTKHVEVMSTKTELTGAMERPAGLCEIKLGFLWASVFGTPTTMLPM